MHTGEGHSMKVVFNVSYAPYLLGYPKGPYTSLLWNSARMVLGDLLPKLRSTCVALSIGVPFRAPDRRNPIVKQAGLTRRSSTTIRRQP